MNYKAQLKAAYLGLLTAATICLTLSCGSSQPTVVLPETPSNKTINAQNACEKTPIIDGMGLNGPYIHGLLQCASNQTSEGQESLDSLQKAINELGPSGLQELIDFALQGSQIGLNSEDRYPYLTALNFLLNRGSDSLSLASQRFDSLQSFLSSLDPYRTVTLISNWQQSGKLEQILGHLAVVVESLKPGSLNALTKEILIGKSLGPSVVSFSSDLLTADSLVWNIERAMKVERSASTGSLAGKDKLTCLNQWVDPGPVELEDDHNQVPTTESSCIQALKQANLELETGPERFERLSASLTKTEKKRFSNLTSSLLQSYSEFNDGERKHLTGRLLKGLKTLTDHDPKLIRSLSGIIQQLVEAKASDLDSIKDAAQTLLEPNYDPTLNKLRAKIGESKLIESLAQLITEGGAVDSCSGLQLEGLASISDFSDQGMMNNIINLWLAPNAACRDLPPLAAAIGDRIGLRLSLDCSQHDQDGSLCIDLSDGASLLSESKISPAPDADLVGKLVDVSLNEVIDALSISPYHLYNLGLASDKINADLIIELKKQYIESAEDLSPRAIANIDAKVEKNPYFKDLAQAFLEKLLSKKIQQLTSTAYQFQSLIPESYPPKDFTSESKAARVFSGTYPNGPMARWLQSHLSEVLSQSSDQLVVSELKARYPHAFAAFIHRLVDADAIFKNPTLAKAGEEQINTSIAGSSAFDFVGFDLDGNWALTNNSILTPNQLLAPSTDRNDPNLAQWSQYLDNSGLITKDMPIALSKKLEQWATEVYASFVSEPAMWADLLLEKPIPAVSIDNKTAAFFESEAYDSSEKRMIVMYLLRNYMKMPFLLPKNASFSGSQTPSEELALSGFLNAAYLSSPYEQQKPWSVFTSLFPNKLKADRLDFEAVRGSLIVDYESYSADPSSLFKIAGYGNKRRLADFAPDKFSEPHKIFSSLSLLTTTQNRKAAYMQPIAGVGGRVCSKDGKDGNDIACPIAFNKAATEQENYASLTTYIASNFDLSFCPVLGSDDLGAAEKWKEWLGFELDLNAIASRCQALSETYDLYTWDKSFKLPNWMVRTILEDITKLGKNPRVRPDLLSLPYHIRLARVANEKDSAHATTMTAARSLLFDASLAFNEKDASKLRRRQHLAAGFDSGSPGLLMQYLNLVEGQLSPELYESYLIVYSKTDRSGETRGPATELLEAFIATQEKLAASGESALTVFLELGRFVAKDPFLLESAINMLVHTDSMQSYDFFARDLPLAVRGLFGSSFDWEEPGLKLIKPIATQQMLLSSSTLRRDFSTSEFTDFVTWLTRATDSWGSASEIDAILRPMLSFVVYQAGVESTEGDDSGFAADIWTEILELIVSTEFPQTMATNWYAMWNDYNLPLSDFNGQQSSSLGETLSVFIEFSWLDLAPMLQLHFEANTKAADTPFYFADLLLDVIEPIQASDTETKESFYQMLADPRLGLASPSIAEQLITEPSKRRALASSIGLISSVPHRDWINALEQLAGILPSFQRVLNFAHKKIEWKDKAAAQSLSKSLEILNGFSQDNAYMMDRQIDLLDIWFDDKPAKMRQRSIP